MKQPDPVRHEDWERHEPGVKVKLFAHVFIDGRSVATITTKEESSFGNNYYYDVDLEVLAGKISPTELFTLVTLEQRARRKLHQFELDLAKLRRAP